ncbi:hypothetical protein [Taibaiella koreensis]|uniref:hypothetical protein n=1 Tax=Taibaiella koreensis TaxID=1268548 RepID=UPI0013C33C50|nr:hypothetical protein [Taibaiella koreensis]
MKRSLWSRFKHAMAYLWGIQPPPTRKDEELGLMIYREHRRDTRKSYWKCYIPQQPYMSAGDDYSRRITLRIMSGKAGPTATQRAFYQQIMERHEAMLPDWVAMIEREGREQHKDLWGTANRWNVTTFVIPFLVEQPVLWEIWLRTKDEVWEATVSMQDWDIVSVFCER